MDLHANLLIANGKNITQNVVSCRYDMSTCKYEITFNTGKTYYYSYKNVAWLKNPEKKNPVLYQISHKGQDLFNIQAIYVFVNEIYRIWHICFEDGYEYDYNETELSISKSCLDNQQSNNIFEYLRQIAFLNELRAEDGVKILATQYEKIKFVGNNTALSMYLQPGGKQNKNGAEAVPLFPFGCNASQYEAVKTALENHISVIQGPPGTGKTQTILNIIANILSEGKTVQVVSNNNSAIINVLEKLSSEKCGLGFAVALLGNVENKQAFLEKQTGRYPDISFWKKNENDETDLLKEIGTKSSALHETFRKQEELAKTRQELASAELEQQHFDHFIEENGIDVINLKMRKNLSSDSLMQLWQECQNISDLRKTPGIWFKLRNIFLYGIFNLKFYRQDLTKMIDALQYLFYRARVKELQAKVNELCDFMKNKSSDTLVDTLAKLSLRYLKNVLFARYGGQKERIVFKDEDFWKNPQSIIREYPVILSTAFSSRASVNKKASFDYVIMDEASQIDVATGALALSCAENAVIVGDTMQLSNVITKEMKYKVQEVYDQFQIPITYHFENSFLQSIISTIGDLPTTMLREHYRCHPKIIDFCNQKFYHGNLLIMTEDHGEQNVLSVIRTVEGNHERGHYNQRQIDVIREEVLPQMPYIASEIGIITPYTDQVKAISRDVQDIETNTVHKFQGREKDEIILSTVDNVLTSFSDDPNLLNVAVSRAKKSLCLVVSGNRYPPKSNLGDLISYIEYNNFELRDSKVYSIFDYLYKQYTKSRFEYLKKHKRISEYDSENLMYALIQEVLKEDGFLSMDVICHQPLYSLLRDLSLLNDRESAYALNPGTHVDFLIFKRVGKKPVLAIEVDGYAFHKEGSEQAERDQLKNHILELYHIPLLRLSTNGSGEREKLVAKLKKETEI